MHAIPENFDELDRLIGLNLRRTRVARKVSRRELAGIHYITEAVLQEMEDGKRPISTELLQGFCRYLQVDAAEMYVKAAYMIVNNTQ